MVARNYHPGDLFRPYDLPVNVNCSSDYAQLEECNIIRTHWLAAASRTSDKKKIKLLAKTFFVSSMLFVVLSGRSKDSPLTIPLRWVPYTGGQYLNRTGRDIPVTWATIPSCKRILKSCVDRKRKLCAWKATFIYRRKAGPSYPVVNNLSNG